MTWEVLAWTGMALAALPCGLFLTNLRAYRPLPPLRRSGGLSTMPLRSCAPRPAVSVLIPARNEERNLPATIAAVLASHSVELELIVLDDDSTDRTAAVVREMQAHDLRVRLESAPPLAAGWCGKQHACHVLARLARHPWLVFLDADVRLEPVALAQMVRFMEVSGAHLASGVPRQETETWSERLLLPLIHFVLLGFLPIARMRRSASPAYAAGCGQLFIARREGYRLCGGHSRIPGSLHDGLRLPKVFREWGLRTDLFDATSLAVCRMYRGHREVWLGLTKNALEGLGAPRVILPMTFLLVGGHALPWLVVLVGWDALGALGRSVGLMALGLSLAPRLLAVKRFHQSVVGALLHPLGVVALVGIQWYALWRHLLGRPARWKGRDYGSSAATRALDVDPGGQPRKTTPRAVALEGSFVSGSSKMAGR